MYETGWLAHINKMYDHETSNKLRTYASFKKVFVPENYVFGLHRSQRRHFSKLRISNHHLDIESGRYTRPITPREQRLCRSCNMNRIGDEIHFLLQCPYFHNERLTMFNKLSTFFSIRSQIDFKTFITLMNYHSGDLEVAKVVCDFVQCCFMKVSD